MSELILMFPPAARRFPSFLSFGIVAIGKKVTIRITVTDHFLGFFVTTVDLRRSATTVALRDRHHRVRPTTGGRG